MKRFVLVIASLLIVCLAFANPVSENAAKSLAEKFMQRPAKARLTHKGMAPAKSMGNTRKVLKASATATPAYYVFNFDDGGFVIVAGEDSVEPVLAYSTTGSFTLDGAPDNIRWWMNGLASDIALIRSGEMKAKPVVRKAAEPGSLRKGTPVLEYETAKWNQTSPFNDECPKNGKNSSGASARSLTGCVATAGAIVARYFKWPDAGEGVTDAYTYMSEDLSVYDEDLEEYTTIENQTIPAKTLGRSYDWANMPLVYRSSASSAQKAAVAAIMADIGYASQMAYNYAAGSGTNDQNLLGAMLRHFKYNKQAYQASRYGYSDAAWKDLLQKNLREVGPMPYGGYDPAEGGHEFVFDGYDDAGYFRVNWGWSGEDDGYFLLDNLGAGNNFSELQSALIDLKPDSTATTTYSDNIMLTPYDETDPGLSTSTKSFSTGRSFTASIVFYYNNAVQPFNGKIYVAVYDKKDNWKENVSSAINVSNLKNPYIEYGKSGKEQDWQDGFPYEEGISCKITGAIKGGDRLRVHYVGQYSSGFARCDDPNGIWEIILAPDTGSTAEQIASSLTLKWSKGTGKLSLSTTLDNISFVMKNASGSTVHSKEMVKAQTHDFDCSALPHGSYTLEFNDSETYSLSFTL